MNLVLNKLRLTNFKNIQQTDLEFEHKFICFVGPNGAGKTNILDAIYYLAFTKSYFNITDSQAVRFGTDFFSISGNFLRHDSTENILISFRKGAKIVKRNEKKYKRLSQHIGLIPAVMITPEDSKIITGSGEDRRKFLDIIISQTDPQYIWHLNNYRKVLQQRNSLIKIFARQKYVDQEQLQLWDERLDKSAQYIYNRRKTIIQELKPVVQQFYNQISNGNEPIDLEYKSMLNGQKLLDILNQTLKKDLVLEFTYAGIHRDDLEMKIFGQPLRKFGSQGQQKSFLLALKFAQYQVIKQHLKITPLLLLDDIFDKLDPTRVQRLVTLVSDAQFGQIFITHTNAQRLKEIIQPLNSQYKIFFVHSGQISQQSKL